MTLVGFDVAELFVAAAFFFRGKIIGCAGGLFFTVLGFVAGDGLYFLLIEISHINEDQVWIPPRNRRKEIR